MILFIVVVVVLLPWPWTCRVWSWMYHNIYCRSALKMGVDKAGAKLHSIKDVHFTKKNQEEASK